MSIGEVVPKMGLAVGNCALQLVRKGKLYLVSHGVWDKYSGTNAFMETQSYRDGAKVSRNAGGLKCWYTKGTSDFEGYTAERNTLLSTLRRHCMPWLQIQPERIPCVCRRTLSRKDKIHRNKMSGKILHSQDLPKVFPLFGACFARTSQARDGCLGIKKPTELLKSNLDLAKQRLATNHSGPFVNLTFLNHHKI